MSFIRSIFLLASVALCVAFAIFTGHGIAIKHTTPVIWGCVFLLCALVLVFLQYRADGKRAR